MNVIRLDSKDLSILYDHAIRDAMLTVSYALQFYIHAAQAASGASLRPIMLESIDRCRTELDKMAAVVQALGHAPLHHTNLSDHSAREWVSLVDPKISSPRVRDLAIVVSGIAICKYLDARYTSLIEISDKLESRTRLDGFQASRKVIKGSERQLLALQAAL